MSLKTLNVEIRNGVQIIEMNRPEVLNALTDEMMRELVEVTRDAADNTSIGCVVLTGAGRGFCTGGDIKAGPRNYTLSREEGGPPEQSQKRIRAQVETARLLHQMPKPTIAMINGPVAGAGIGLAGACDLRFAAHSAAFRTAFARIGAAGDFGSTWSWTHILGTAMAREIFLLDEKIPAERAHAMGIYTRIYPDDELRKQTLEIAKKIAAGPKMAWRYMKMNLNNAQTSAYEAHLEQESLNMGLSVQAAIKIYRAEKETKKKTD